MSDNPNVPKEVRVLLEVVVVPKDGNTSDFWDPSETLVGWELAHLVLGKGTDGWKVQSIRPAE